MTLVITVKIAQTARTVFVSIRSPALLVKVGIQ